MRPIPIDLLEHKRSSATTLCNLVRIETKDGEVLGMTTLDRDVRYDDGRGEVVYRAAVGFEPASIYASSDFGVDNTEATALVPAFDLQLSEERVNSGAYNYAEFWLYEVNYENLDQGHWTVMHGTLGELKSVDGVTLFGEFRSLMDGFRKPLCELDSLTCRAKFGSQHGEERFPCGFDASQLWISGTVETVGAELDRTFFDPMIFEEDGTFEPGLVEFTSGQNAGHYSEVERQLVGRIDLAFPTPYPIQAGDTYRRRRDCNKRARDEQKGCKHWFGPEWIHHFRGEPDIPVGDAGQLQTPGAGVGPGHGGGTHTPFEEQDQ